MSKYKDPIQLNLALKPKNSHGGKRKNAGRPNLSKLRAHLKRPVLDAKHPLHVTLKLSPGLPSLRKKELFQSLKASVRTARKRGFTVVHFAILSNHIHLILETQEGSLRSVFQSLCISFAKRLNRHLKRKGSVFLDRYHVHVLKTPTEVRNALSYVLTNDARHRSRNSPKITKYIVSIDPFSSAYRFKDWKRLLSSKVQFEFSGWSEDIIEAWYSQILVPAQTWLLISGWTLGRG